MLEAVGKGSILVMMLFCIVFFFKQKTAYEIVSRDWSSDVCSSDLIRAPHDAGLFGTIFLFHEW